MFDKIRRKKCDVLIVGGGGAGLRAAIAAKESAPGIQVILATKGELGRSGVTAVACSDRMAFHATLPFTEPGGEDNWRYHAEDIFEIGGRVSDANLATVLAKNAAEAYYYLESIGVPFAKKEGRPHQFVTDGSDYPRACYTGPKTAVHMEENLLAELMRHGIEYLNNCQLCSIIGENKRVSGALALISSDESYDEEPLYIETGAIVMATGGGGEIFSDNVFPRGNSGDGCSAALRAGAELVNMEFIQLGIASLKTKLNCSGSIMRAIPRVINDEGEEILFKYFPDSAAPMEVYEYLFQKGASWPVTFEHKTHIFDIAFYKERMEGRKVYLDFSANPSSFDFSKLSEDTLARYGEEIKDNLGIAKRAESPFNRLQEINADSVTWLRERGIDLEAGQMIEVGICAQHFQGGIRINQNGETAVSGLYAAGECAGGQHGANRPGGNALLDGQVFGKICGENAASYAQKERTVQNNRQVIERELKRLEKFGHPGDIAAESLRQEIQKIMNDNASVVRTAGGLQEGLRKLKSLKERKMSRDKNGLAYAIETEAMLEVATVVLAAAFRRDESRGPHLRFNYFKDKEPIPRQDPRWQKYLVINRLEDGNLKITEEKPVSEYDF